MSYVLVILTLIAAVLLIGVVLIQKSKGGGLSSTFAGSNQIMGVRRTNSFIEKLTWTLAAAIAVLAIISSFFIDNSMANSSSRVASAPTEQTTGIGYDQSAAAPAPAAEQAPAPAPAPAPAK